VLGQPSWLAIAWLLTSLYHSGEIVTSTSHDFEPNRWIARQPTMWLGARGVASIGAV